MSSECAICNVYACRAGRIDAAPEGCPMRDDFPDFEVLYGGEEKLRMAYQSARIEAEGYCRWTRAREIVEFCRRMGYGRVGIAHCPDTEEIAGRAATYLESHGLRPFLPAAPGGALPPVPLAAADQAASFARAGTELNVICGMCVGHEAIFVRASKAPVTALVARDPRLRHNPVAALYTSGTYYQSALFERHRAARRASYRGSDLDTLEALAAQVHAEAGDGWCRVEEAIEYARRLGAARLGVTFCVGFRDEANRLVRVLEANGFEVASACCKAGAVPKERLGIEDSQKVRPGQPEMICNPIAQAELLNREQVQLTLLLGQCVGHDSATMAHLDSPAACVVVKDRVLAHNSVAALMEAHD